MSRAYYNEFDPFAAQWLRNLISAGHIAPGDVDERSIVEVKADDLAGYNQCHFFAGIGGWSLALRLAGVPDDFRCWTGSCPCQPFSEAGHRRGASDDRHLWPELRRLIDECRPAIAFGEQVESKGGREWLAGVRTDLEALGYRFGAADLCAAGFGAPQIRQRLYWLAHSAGFQAWRQEPGDGLPSHVTQWSETTPQVGRCCDHHGEQVRRAPPGVLLVADGVSANVDAVMPFGNAIVPQVAAAFIQAALG